MGKIKQKKVIESPLEFKGNDGKVYKISLQQKEFCEKYLTLSGNGAMAYLEIYKVKNIRVAAALASRALTLDNIIAYIDLKLEEYGFSDENVKKQHLFTLNQFADLSSKNKAIDMFYKLKGSYAPEQVQHSLNESDIDEQITRVRAELEAIRTPKTEDITE